VRAQTGTVLGGRYALTSPVASGGMGEVWRAHDELLGRTVAVKVLRSELASDPGFLTRFRTEARNSARLADPAIATTYDYGESDGSAYLVMELVPGEPLSELLAREGALEPRRAMRLLSRAASGLAAAHAAGLVHRDVKPGNLLVTPDGWIKVTDFGIARALAEAPLTATGQVMGTAAYLSPEQATGRRDLTPAADVYALGIVAHEMLAGQRPFTGESQVAIALAQVNDPPPPLPTSIPASARALVSACLAKDPRDRPSDAGTVARVAGLIADGDDAGALSALGAAPTAPLAPATGATGPTAAATSALGAGAAAGALPWPEPDRTGGTVRQDPAGAAGGTGPVGEPAGAAGPGGPARTGGLPAGDEGPGRPRRRLTVPLLGLLAVLVVVVAALALSRRGTPTPTPTPTPSVTTPAPVPTRSTSSARTTAPRTSSSTTTSTGGTSPTSSSLPSTSPTTTTRTTRTPTPTTAPTTAPTTTPAAAGAPAGSASPPASAASEHMVGGEQDEDEAGIA
jgi:eukaryotic-like serine/threonine-protein kinase